MTAPIVRTPAETGRTGAIVAADSSFEDLYEFAPCGYLSTQPDGVVVRVNRTLLEWTGYAQDEVVGRPFADLLSVGSQLFYETRCLPVLRLEGQVREVALELRKRDGQPLSILINCNVRAGRNGMGPVVRTAVFDATGRKDYERDLLRARRAAERSEVRVRVLQQASAAFGAAPTQESLTAALARIARVALDATSTAVMLLAPGARELRSVVEGANPIGDTVDLAGGRPEAEALRLNRVVTVSSVDEAEVTFPELAGPLYRARLDAMTATPLLNGDVPLGVLASFFGRGRQFDADELELQSALGRQATQVLQRIRLQHELQHLALHDKLTGLANRELLDTRLTQVLLAATRRGRPMALAFLDLDGFKAVNDHLGHAVGDSVLVEVANRLRQVVRGSDTIARFGGDEFVVVCEEADADAAVRLADRIRAAVRRPFAGVPATFPVTASIGVARHLPGTGPSPEPDAVVVEADAAMYRSKSAGKDRSTMVDV